MTCPDCGSSNLHRSRRRWFERPLALLGIRPYRCYDCDLRFFAKHRLARRTDERQKPAA